MASTVTLPQVNLSPTLGAALIGVVFAAIFLGITILQSTFYVSYQTLVFGPNLTLSTASRTSQYRTYSKDPVFLKLLVSVLLILDTLSVALLTHGIYTYLVTDFDNLMAVDSLVCLNTNLILDLSFFFFPPQSEPVVSGVVALIVHLFLAYRIQVLDHRWRLLSAFIGVASIFPCADAIGKPSSLVTSELMLIDAKLIFTSSVAVVMTDTSISSLSALTELRWTSCAGVISTSTIDLIIAASISYLLHSKRSGFAQTDRMINKITLYVISTGLITRSVQLLLCPDAQLTVNDTALFVFFSTLTMSSMIAYLLAPTEFYFLMINFSTSKAYTNTLLATLTSRQYHGEPTPSSLGTVLRFRLPNMDSDGIGEASNGSGSQDVIAPVSMASNTNDRIPGT
ncbi:hypothetical protein J3R83DRAFT_3206 [Lanmaoa asiatica]|nr:hypothetical protein J3R83DRAFT_3206 [Lanmaoa asiatica]